MLIIGEIIWLYIHGKLSTVLKHANAHVNLNINRNRTHPHLTTLSDEEIIGELGWTMQIIHDVTGKVPLYYRPPYGDVGTYHLPFRLTFHLN